MIWTTTRMEAASMWMSRIPRMGVKTGYDRRGTRAVSTVGMLD
jgi:hypothetical protein